MTPLIGSRLAAVRESRPCRLYLAGRVCSHSGNGAHVLAVTALVWNLSGSATAVGVVAAVQYLPQLALAPVAGVLVDRVPRRRAMLVQQSCALGLATVMAGVTLIGCATVWVVYAVTFAVGVSTAVSNPLQQALLGEMTSSLRVRQSAVALNAATLQVGTLAGAGVAGVLLPAVGPGWVMAASPVTYLVALVLLGWIRPAELMAPSAPAGVVRLDLGVGVRHVVASPELRATVVASAGVAVVGMGAITTGAHVLVLTGFASTLAGGSLLGWVAAATAVGGIAALVHVAGAHAPRPRTLVVHMLGLAGAVGAAALAPGLVVALIALAAAAWAAHAHQALAQVMLHRAPAELHGRVSGVWFACTSGGRAFAGLLVGVLTEALSPGPGLLVAAGLLAVTALAVTTAHRAPAGRTPATSPSDLPAAATSPTPERPSR